jgi:hypothetical protein
MFLCPNKGWFIFSVGLLVFPLVQQRRVVVFVGLAFVQTKSRLYLLAYVVFSFVQLPNVRTGG